MVLPKACNIMLNDGTYLYNSVQVFDYLLSLGFVREDLEDTLACELDIPQTLFDRIMTAWDNYHLKNSYNSKEEYDALTNAISVCGFDNKETWRDFVLEKIK